MGHGSQLHRGGKRSENGTHFCTDLGSHLKRTYFFYLSFKIGFLCRIQLVSKLSKQSSSHVSSHLIRRRWMRAQISRAQILRAQILRAQILRAQIQVFTKYSQYTCCRR